MNKSYPVGTAIKYLGGCCKCKGKIGTITARYSTYCTITLPKSTCSAAPRVVCGWDEIELVKVKGRQLLFDFMEQDA